MSNWIVYVFLFLFQSTRILVSSVSSVIYTTIPQTWTDDFKYSSSEWVVQSHSGAEVIDETSSSKGNEWHGPYTNDQFYLYRSFYCEEPSTVSVSFAAIACGTTHSTYAIALRLNGNEQCSVGADLNTDDTWDRAPTLANETCDWHRLGTHTCGDDAYAGPDTQVNVKFIINMQTPDGYFAMNDIDITCVPVPSTTILTTETATTSVTTSIPPVTTSIAPLTTSIAPVTTSIAPMTTSIAPVTTHIAPVTTYLAPVTTHIAPVTTSTTSTSTTTTTTTTTTTSATSSDGTTSSTSTTPQTATSTTSSTAATATDPTSTTTTTTSTTSNTGASSSTDSTTSTTSSTEAEGGEGNVNDNMETTETEESDSNNAAGSEQSSILSDIGNIKGGDTLYVIIGCIAGAICCCVLCVCVRRGMNKAISKQTQSNMSASIDDQKSFHFVSVSDELKQQKQKQQRAKDAVKLEIAGSDKQYNNGNLLVQDGDDQFGVELGSLHAVNDVLMNDVIADMNEGDNVTRLCLDEDDDDDDDDDVLIGIETVGGGFVVEDEDENVPPPPVPPSNNFAVPQRTGGRMMGTPGYNANGEDEDDRVEAPAPPVIAAPQTNGMMGTIKGNGNGEDNDDDEAPAPPMPPVDDVNHDEYGYYEEEDVLSAQETTGGGGMSTRGFQADNGEDVPAPPPPPV